MIAGSGIGIVQLLSTEGLGTLKCISINIRSLHSNFDLLRATQNINNYGIIGLQETWANKHNLNYILNGFDYPIFRNRQNRNGGGVCFYIKEGLIYEMVRSPFDEGILETIAISLKVGGKK